MPPHYTCDLITTHVDLFGSCQLSELSMFRLVSLIRQTLNDWHLMLIAARTNKFLLFVVYDAYLKELPEEDLYPLDTREISSVYFGRLSFWAANEILNVWIFPVTKMYGRSLAARRIIIGGSYCFVVWHHATLMPLFLQQSGGIFGTTTSQRPRPTLPEVQMHGSRTISWPTF